MTKRWVSKAPAGMNRDSGPKVSRHPLYGKVSESPMPWPGLLPRLRAIESKNPVNRRSSAPGIVRLQIVRPTTSDRLVSKLRLNSHGALNISEIDAVPPSISIAGQLAR